MYCFLDSYYWKDKSDELGGLFGSMSLLPDNTPADQAYEEDWKIAVSQIVGQREVNVLTSDTIYWAMIAFLRSWSDLGTNGAISDLCEILKKSSSKSEEWLEAVKTVMAGNDEPYLNLINDIKSEQF